MHDKPDYSRLHAHLGQPLPLSSLADSHPSLAALAAANPQLDLLRANLFDPATIESLGSTGTGRDTLLDDLRTCQRLARIGVAPQEMEALRQAGLHSAHQIADLPRDRFTTQFADSLRGSGDAADIHALACSVQARVTHAWAWLRDTMAPHVRNNRYLRPSDELLEAMTAIPSYNDLFGTLDYVSVPDCQSVLGPAAYFVDLMRLVEQAIIAPNTAIPADWQLKTRRPDLFTIELTCAETNTAVPKIDVINDVLSARLKPILGNDTDYAVATRVFPFSLPQNLSLTALRATLKASASPLADLYADFQVQTGGAAVMPTTITTSAEALGLSAEQRAVVTAPTLDPAVLGQYFGLPAGSTAPSPVQLPVPLGQVSISGTTVTGSGFPSSVNGWVISAGGSLRVVTAVSATQITVDCAWPQALTNVPATAYAPQSLSQLAVFSAATGLATPQVVRLLKQDLAPEEVAAALGHNFFINRTNPGMTVISLVTDMSDANYSLDILSNLTLANMDAINRFLRLAAATGWSYADLDWGLKSGGFTEITDDALTHLAAVASLCKRLSLPTDEACGLFADLKTYGRGAGTTAADLYDRVFNATASSVGRTPYRPTYAGNPLFTSQPIVWNVGSFDAADRATQTWLAGTLQLTEADLLLVAKRMGGTPSLTLDVPTLSRFYAYAKLARALKMKVPALLQAMDLLGLAQLDGLGAVQQVVAFKDWLEPSGLSLADATYVVTGAFDSKVTGALDPAAVPPFLTSLRALARPWLLNAASFVFDDIDAPRSAEIFAALVAARILDPSGVVVAGASPAFSDLAPVFPVTADTLVSDVVSPTDAAAAITLLQQHKLLDGTVLTAAVTTATDLSFLFPNDPERLTKIDSVQDDLIAVSTDCSHSCDVVGGGLDDQRLGAFTQLALLIEDSVAMAAALAEFTLLPAGNPLLLLLTSAGTDAIMVPAITTADRLAFAAARLSLDANAMRLACILESDYGFSNLNAPSLDDLRLLALYSQLLKAFDNDSNDMAGYMTAPEQPLNVKMDALAQLTGWSADQCTVLVQALWGGSGFGGLDALATMRRCFVRAQILGAEITSVLGIAATAGLERLPLPTFSGGSQASWQQWTVACQAASDMLKARYGAAAWSEIYKPVHDAVAESRRQSLVELAVLLLSPTIPAITSARTLSEYLLIDVEAGPCNVTTPILETTAAAQMYIQRSRMALEEGVTSVSISDLTWSWMGSYRMWEANRKVFIYPENYLNPSLRRQRTPLFSAFMDQLQQDEITDATVTNAFTQYMTSFAELATIQPVDAVNCRAPNVDTGELVDQTIVLGRTAEAPYTYYWRTLEDGVIWSAWYTVDAKIPVPVVTPYHAFGRLFLFWAEAEETSGSTIQGGNQVPNSGFRASIKYIFQRLDKSWTAPQVLVENVVFQYQPADYTTALINTAPTADSLAGIDPSQPYWYRPYVVLQPGQSGASDQLVVALGNAYRTITDVPAKPPGNGSASLQQLDQSIYNAGLLSAAAQKAQSQKTAGSVVMLPVAVLDDTLTVNQAWALFQNADISNPGGPRPFGGLAYQGSMVLIPSTNVLIDNMLSEAPDYYSRVSDGSPWSTLLYNLSPSAEVVPVKNQPGWWIFNNGDEAFLAVTDQVTLNRISEIVSITPNALTLASGASEVTLGCAAFSPDPISVPDLSVKFTRLTTGAVGRLSQLLFAGGVDALLTITAQTDPGPGRLCFGRFFSPTPTVTNPCDPTGGPVPPPPNTIPPDVMCGGQVDFSGAYRPYYEEIFFHAPFLVAYLLNANQRFQEAKRWYDFIFDPTAGVTQQGQAPAVFWQYEKFRADQTLPTLAQVLSDNTAIARWNNHPFDPFSVADLRLSAFKKTIVMHYIDNLLDWGDQQFGLDTRESLGQALLLYLMAYDLLGPRPRERGVRPTPSPITFQDIVDTYGTQIPQFLIDVENALPAPSPGSQGYAPAPFNLVNAYFGVSENKEFMAYWTRIEDRLYKLRNCQNLSGQVRQLPFFDAPIDPNQLVAAAGKGGELPVVVDRSPVALPNYRFATMVERAKAVTQTLIGFGASLLSALEKKDAEQLSLLRVTQERAVWKMTTQVKEQQVIDAQETVNSLKAALESAEFRVGYYKKLLEEGLSPAEATSIAMMVIANIFSTQAGVMKAMAGVSHLIPNVGSPFAMTYGGEELGSSFDALGSVFDLLAQNFNFASTLSNTVAGYQRRDQEWSMQQQVASYEVTQMNAQIAAAQARLTMAKRDMQLNALQIEQSDETEQAMLDKFTNQELYTWMAGRLSALYFQTYKLAFDMAMEAQRAYQFEQDSGATFIDFGYWDSRRKGLLAGEGLLLGLSQMERAHMAGNTRRLTMTKTISLRDLNPMALLQLRQTGKCAFEFSELLFDCDYPGHFCRKIESVSVTVPAVVGPYQDLHGTLTQTGNSVLMVPDEQAVLFLLGEETTAPVDSVLRINWRSNQQIALSRAVDDTGMAASQGSDDRYVPFEGTGAISQWTLELPQRNNAFDFEALADVIITLTYSALPGSQKFRDFVASQLPTEVSRARLVSLSQQFPAAWYAFMNPLSGQTSEILSFNLPREVFPSQVNAIELTGAMLQLVVENTTFVGPMPVSLSVQGGTATALTFPRGNVNVTTPPLQVAFDPAGQWSFSVKITDIPNELKSGDRFDPSKLTGLNLVVTYSGTIA